MTDKWGHFSHLPDLNFGQRSRHKSEYLPLMTQPRICSRCLANTHARENCRAPIKCLNCLRWGHVQVNCPVNQQECSNSSIVTGANKGKANLEQPTQFNAASGPGPSNPPVFSSFSDWAASHLHLPASTRVHQTVPWVLPDKPMTSGPSKHRPHFPENGSKSDNMELNLSLTLSSSNRAELFKP